MATIASRKITLNVSLNSTVKGYLPLSWRNLSGFSFSVRGLRKTINNNYEPYTGKLVSSTAEYVEVYGDSNFKTVSLSGQRLSFDMPSSATHIEVKVSYQNDKYSGPAFVDKIAISNSNYYLSYEQTMNKFFGYIAYYYCNLFNLGKIDAHTCLSCFRGFCLPTAKQDVYSDSFDDFSICHEIGHSISYRIGNGFGAIDLAKITIGGAFDIVQYALADYDRLSSDSKKAVMHLEFPAELMKNIAIRKARGLSANIDYGYFNLSWFSHEKAVLADALSKVGLNDGKLKNLMIDIAKTMDWDSLKTTVSNFK